MPTNGRTAEQVRAEIEDERERLAEAVDQLREGIGVASKLRSRLLLVGAGALAAGFVVAGGIGATARLLFRRGREGTRKARVGRFTFVDRG